MRRLSIHALCALFLVLCAACGSEGSPGTADETSPSADAIGADIDLDPADAPPAADTQAGDDTGDRPNDEVSPPSDTGTDSGDDGETTGPMEHVTYHGQMRALIDVHCNSCHVSGGVAPFPLESWDEVQPLAMSITTSVASGRMPPWHADDDCHPLHGSRALDSATLAAFEAWQSGGFPEGDAADYVAPDRTDHGPSLGPPSLQLDAGVAYTASRARPDDYRCLPLDYTFAEDTFVIATDVFPDQAEMVHHVLLYLVEPDGIARLEQLEANDDGPGYTCFGGPRAGSGTTLAGWVPGGQPMIYPEGAAILIPAGSRIVMQVHYNLLALPAATPVPADRSEVAFWTLETGERPASVVSITPLAHTGIRIEAGDPASVHERTFPVPGNVTLVGVAPHMHTLGTRIRAELERRNGERQCLVDVPEWDFNWQQFYRYPEDAFIHATLGEQIHLRCEYDNSPENQPIINGERLEPRDVRWGDGTLDEMCLNYIITTRPYYTSSGADVCSTFESCYETCAEGDHTCFVSCAVGDVDLGCVGCVFSELRPCIERTCAAAAAPLLLCVNRCENNLDCIVADCMDTIGTLYTCLEPHLRDGSCDPELAACEVSLGPT